MKNIKPLILVFFLMSFKLFSQTINDYRTINSGNWIDSSIWEIFDGANWIPATNYPGEVLATNNVTIGNDASITLNSSIPGSINSVTLGDQSGGIDTILITNTASLNTPIFTIAYDGFLNWIVNKTFSFPAGAIFIVESPNPDPTLELGVHHGIFENTMSCSAAKILEIGTVKYSTCNGSGGKGVVSFEVVNNSGGNLTVSPSGVPIVACTNTNIQLNANPGGTEIGETPLTYTWSAIAPVGYTFSSIMENPTDIPTTPGIYTYQVILENNDGLTTTGSISITIQNCVKTIITNRRITYRVTP